MEQKDYLMREIEKIGAIVMRIRQRLFGGKENLAIGIEQQVQDLKGMLLNDANFELDKLLNLSPSESNKYICNFKGFSVENIEILADCFS